MRGMSGVMIIPSHLFVAIFLRLSPVLTWQESTKILKCTTVSTSKLPAMEKLIAGPNMELEPLNIQKREVKTNIEICKPTELAVPRPAVKQFERRRSFIARTFWNTAPQAFFVERKFQVEEWDGKNYKRRNIVTALVVRESGTEKLSNVILFLFYTPLLNTDLTER